MWLHLVHHLDIIREPAALPGWLATTTRRECLRARRTAQGSHAAGYVPDVENIPDERAKTAEQELLAAERHAALRAAFGDLSPFSQQLLALLTQDPPMPYAEISARLGIPVGSIRTVSRSLPGEAAPASVHRRADKRRRPKTARRSDAA